MRRWSPGCATTPYAAYHFHRLAPYGVLANLLAMPIVSVWVMPTGLLALLAMPFGFDGAVWRLMGDGIDWMIAVALWVASLPGAVGRMAAFGTGPLLLGTAGLVLLCLLRSPLRWSGAALIVAGEPVGAPHAAAGCAGRRRRATLSRCAAPTDGSPIASHRQRHLRRYASGSPPTPTRALPNDKTLRRGHPLRRGRLHRAGLPTARSCAGAARPKPSRRTAAAPRWS